MRRVALLVLAMLLASISLTAEARAFVMPSAQGSGRCLPGMVLIPGGTFVMTAVKREVTVAPFCLDRTEVTVAAASACFRSGRCPKPPDTVHWPSITAVDRDSYSRDCNARADDKGDHPLNCVDWHQAGELCQGMGRRLPTEEEWEWAARAGDQGKRYPWGDDPPKDQLCWSGVSYRSNTCAVGSFPEGDNPWGVHDLSGNLVEWTSSRIDPTSENRVLRGGAFSTSDAPSVSAGERYGIDTIDRRTGIGFRCARSW